MTAHSSEWDCGGAQTGASPDSERHQRKLVPCFPRSERPGSIPEIKGAELGGRGGSNPVINERLVASLRKESIPLLGYLPSLWEALAWRKGLSSA